MCLIWTAPRKILNVWIHLGKPQGCQKMFLERLKVVQQKLCHKFLNFDTFRLISFTWMLHSYGYRGRDCRNNLLILPTGEIVYHIAAVVILLDRVTGEQRHYLGHNDDIKWQVCLAYIIYMLGNITSKSRLFIVWGCLHCSVILFPVSDTWGGEGVRSPSPTLARTKFFCWKTIKDNS